MRRHREALDEEELEGPVVSEEMEGEEEEEIDNSALLPQDVDGKTALHEAAATGDLEGIKALLASLESGSISGSGSANSDMMHARDANDWQAVHEAAAGGHLEVLQYLLDNGADLNAVTKEGGNVLWWARTLLKEDDPVIVYLESIGAVAEASPAEESE